MSGMRDALQVFIASSHFASTTVCSCRDVSPFVVQVRSNGLRRGLLCWTATGCPNISPECFPAARIASTLIVESAETAPRGITTDTVADLNVPPEGPTGLTAAGLPGAGSALVSGDGPVGAL